MNEDERELLKQLCDGLATLSEALADGDGLHDLQRINRSIHGQIGPLFERVFPPESGISIKCQTLPDGSIKLW